jgi:hypothetical protein
MCAVDITPGWERMMNDARVGLGRSRGREGGRVGGREGEGARKEGGREGAREGEGGRERRMGGGEEPFS